MIKLDLHYKIVLMSSLFNNRNHPFSNETATKVKWDIPRKHSLMNNFLHSKQNHFEYLVEGTTEQEGRLKCDEQASKKETCPCLFSISYTGTAAHNLLSTYWGIAIKIWIWCQRQHINSKYIHYMIIIQLWTHFDVYLDNKNADVPLRTLPYILFACASSAKSVFKNQIREEILVDLKINSRFESYKGRKKTWKELRLKERMQIANWVEFWGLKPA